MLTRRTFLAAGAAAAHAQRQSRPNVLFIAADDMNTALGCYGHPIVKTPNVDSLARKGVRFDRAYCQFPLCGPSRASLLTGLRPDTTQVLGNNIDFRDFHPKAVTLPQLFKNNGWFSAREGKMYHMNVPGEVGTPKYQDEASWNHSVSPQGLENKTEGTGRKLNPPGVTFGMNWISAASPDGQADTNAADHALALLEAHRGQPFFLGLGFIRPHLPFVAPSRFYDMYKLDAMRPANNPPDDLDDIPAAAKKVRPQLWNNMKMDEPRIREALRGYYASTSFMDDQLGRVLSGLRQMGLESNTIIVFWGDHGWNLGEHTRWQKMSIMEQSARVPLIISAPGRKGNGKACRSLVEFVDVYPGIAELCGLTPPPTLEGQSLVPLLDNPQRRWKKAAFTQLKYEDITGRAIRTARYRYIRWEGQGGGEELYDHDRDPGEFTNLASKAVAKATLEEHRKILDSGWRAARA
ncbi:MAG: sulfatase [Acidobacteria bacterium]|nr:sulfatase [Acidobacteriota bacterium]